ncbi:hypothetical protein cypCar_00034794 [Cyprinus carpio]|nr:hypothetical protein cypCar_00034794 [Cyprinus carpio]
MLQSTLHHRRRRHGRLCIIPARPGVSAGISSLWKIPDFTSSDDMTPERDKRNVSRCPGEDERPCVSSKKHPFSYTKKKDFRHWGVPFAITVAALSLHKIGYDASEVSVGWCWVNIQAKDHVLWMLLTGKIWEFIAYVTLPVLYILIKIHIHNAHAALSEYRPILTSSPVSHSLSSMADRKLTLIPIIFIMLRMWSTIRFLLLLTNSPAGHNPVLVTLHGIGNTFQGAANCIMFVLLTPSIRSRLLALLCCRGQDRHWHTDSVSQNRASAHTPSCREENTNPQTWENSEG